MRLHYLLAGLLITAATPAFAQLDWLNHEGNPQHTNSLPITTNPANYHTLWQSEFQPNHDSKASFLMDLLIADNHIAYSYLTITSDDKGHDYIYTVDTETGKLLWSIENAGTTQYYLTYQSGVLLTSNFTDNNSVINAYDLKSSQHIYSATLPDPRMSLYSDGSQTYLYEYHAIGSLNAADGSVNWLTPLAAGKYFSSAMALNDKYIIDNDFDGVRLFSRKNGAEVKKIWVPDASTINHEMPAAVVDNQTAYSILQSSDKYRLVGTLYAYDLASGQVKWTVPNQSAEYTSTITRTIILTNHTVLTLSPQFKNLNAFDATTGKQLWTWAIPADEQVWQPVMVATSDVIFIALKNHVFGISLQTHDVVWKGDFADADLMLGSGKLFIVWHGDTPRGQDKQSYITAIALN